MTSSDDVENLFNTIYSLFNQTIMKKYLLMLCCAVVCTSFVGCSDDEGVNVESLVGRWSCYQEWDAEDSYIDDEFGEGVDLYNLRIQC